MKPLCLILIKYRHTYTRSHVHRECTTSLQTQAHLLNRRMLNKPMEEFHWVNTACGGGALRLCVCVWLGVEQSDVCHRAVLSKHSVWDLPAHMHIIQLLWQQKPGGKSVKCLLSLCLSLIHRRTHTPDLHVSLGWCSVSCSTTRYISLILGSNMMYFIVLEGKLLDSQHCWSMMITKNNKATQKLLDPANNKYYPTNSR